MIPESEKDNIFMPNVSSRNINDGIVMTGGSNVRGNLENNNGNGSSLDAELEFLLLQQQLHQGQRRNRDLSIQRERDLDIYRSGSAPPTVEGAFSAVGSILRSPQFGQFTDSGRGSGSDTNGVLTEEEIRSHPAYLAYYYSNENNNPRLPPPLLSKEDWRVAQRVGSSFGGIGNWRNKNVINDAGSSSLFSMQPGLSVQKAEDELMELRKAATSNLLRKSSPELLDRGMLGMSDASMGSRRKSFADIVQEGLGQPATITAISEVLHPRQMVPGLSGVQNIGSSLAESFSSPLHSPSTRSRTPDPHLIGRTPSPGLRNADFGVGLGDGVNVSGSNSLSGFSSGVTEIANVAASLAGLNMSKDQFLNKDNRLHSQLQFLDKSRAENLATATNYTNLMRENGVVPPNLNNSSLGPNGQNFPRRTYSSASLHSQVNHRGFASPADRNSYDNVCNNHPATGLASPSASLNGRSLRKNVGQAGSNLHTTLMDPRHAHHLHESYHQKMNAGLLPGNPSQTRNCIRNSHGLEDLQDFGRMYLETLLAQQKQQYQSSGLQHRYNGNPALDHCMPYQGNQMAESAHPTVGSGRAMCHNERMPRVPSMLNNSIGTGSWHPETETNMEGRLASTLLEELKNSPTRPLELSDVLGHVVEFSKDQNGSRFIQQKLETATIEEKMKIFPEIIPHARALMTDVFGNYVIQKFFKHGMESHRKELASQLIGHVLPLSLQMYGCRVIQKALEVVEVEQQTQMVAELDGSVLKCVRDQNGNHVIQKCIECVPQDRIHFIISSVFGQVVALSMHPYGCRVIQRVLEHCDDPKTQKIIMDEIMHSICTLAQDQYGNYVIQHVLQHGKPHERSVIISKLTGQIVKMSQQKFASNVVEKCLTFGSPEECQLLVNEMLGSTDENEPLQAMMKDPFGNYVVQKVLETCDDQSREYILSRIKVHLNALKKYTYGKHIVSRVEKLITTGERHKDSSRFAS